MTSISAIQPATALCGIIGDPVEHSMSPAIHNAAFEATGQNFVYLAFRVARGQVGRVLDAMRVMDTFRGLSVTIPHKMEVVACVDELNETDAAIGSINTVINDSGRLRGFGSDGPGARKALLDKGISTAGEDVVIFGSGGAARAIAFDLAFHATPRKIVLIGVIEAEVTALAADLNRKSGASATGLLRSDDVVASALGNPAIVINTSPVGMFPRVDERVIPARLLHKELRVMDIVYNPLETALLRDARAMGISTVSGIDMFIHQAAIQFKAFTGKDAPEDLMREVALERLLGR